MKEDRIEDVKQPQSNALRHGLAKGHRAEPHPDEDMLTAFAEHSLLDRERESVMEHLAVCAECREVLSLAATATPETVIHEKLHTLPVRPPLRSWLPWVATAAGLAVVGSAVLLHERNAQLRQQSANPAVNMAQVETAPPMGNQPPQSVVTPEPAAAHQQPPLAAKKAVPSPHQDQGSAVASLEQKEQKESPVPPEAVQASAGVAAYSVTPEIASQNADVHGRIAAQSNSNSASALNKAGQAPALAARSTSGLISGFSGALARAHWRISDTGQAQRSVGNGAWQPVLPDEKTTMRVVSVFGRDVWIGGEGLRLYHSDDDGATWHFVQLPNKGGGAHAITHIRFQGDQAGTVEADDGTQWSTVDGGNTWK